MGYYLNRSSSAEKNLFEFLQEDLEKYTNRLSELYETNISFIDSYAEFMKWKLEVTDFTRISHNVRFSYLNPCLFSGLFDTNNFYFILVLN
jgi:hypothetical protein